MVPMTDTLALINKLVALEKPSWRGRQYLLDLSGVPQNNGGEGGEGAGPAGGGGEGVPAGGGSGGEGGESGAPASGSGGEGSGEPKMFDENYVKELRSENARFRTENRDLKAAEQARKDAELSDLERERKQREEAEKKAARLEREALQRKVADEAGLDSELVEFLTGEDEDAMTAQAEKLKVKGPKKIAPKVAGGPQGDGAPNGVPATPDELQKLIKADPAKFNDLMDKGQIPASALGGK